MKKLVYDELTNQVYLIEDDGELQYLITEVLSKLSEEELVNLLGESQIEKLRSRK